MCICIYYSSKDSRKYFCCQVLKESVRIYQAISDGMINLVDKVCTSNCVVWTSTVYLDANFYSGFSFSSLKCNGTMLPKHLKYINEMDNRL